MKRGLGVHILLAAGLALSAMRGAAAEEGQDPLSFDDSAIVSSHYPEWFKSSFMDVRDDLADARDGGKTGLMLFFGSEGCAYCRAFIEHTLNDPGVQARVRESFDVIGLDMFSDIEITDVSGSSLAVKDFAVREGVGVSPTVVFDGSDGTPLLHVPGYFPPERFRVVLDYVAGGHIATASLRDYAAKDTVQGDPRPPVPLKDPLFQGV